MKHYTHKTLYTLVGIMLLALCGAVHSVAAQDQKPSANRSSARSGERDPFAKYKAPVKRVVPKNIPVPVMPPTIQARIDQYKALKMEAMRSQQPAPKPTTALLLSEMQVIGIFRTPRGYAAMVEASPIKLSYVVYPGEMFFDGQLVAIEEDRLVFRHETRWTDGRVVKNVETKPLRQPNAVSDSLAATKTQSSTAGAPASEPAAKTEEKAANPQKQ
ncbi:MAG TPA: hypothetical protein VGB17_16840 [Pyrinomonadaceae bacterium]|jgi:hypothetical protein